MRITSFLLLAACLQVSARTYAQRITLKEKDAPLDKIFANIEAQTGYSFAYTGTQLSQSRPVSIEVTGATLDQVLAICFLDQPFTYTIIENTIVIKPKPTVVLQSVASSLSPPPPTDTHGHITDSLGNPLVGASVTVKGSKKGTSTDAQGNFDLKGVDGNATLLISFTGFESREIKLNGRNEIAIQLKQGSTQLLDVVVSKGYYSTTNRLNTGDVTTVVGEEIQEQPVSDPILALEAKVPGLFIQQTSGIPGAYSTVRIMGQNSISNGNDPLYVIDGVPFSSTSLTNTQIGGGAVGDPEVIGQGMSPFNGLDPSNIASIEVLKDADATAIYGSRGANGVILITTKKGKSGNTKIDVNVFSGSGKVTRMMNLLNTSQYLEMRHEAYENDGITSIPSNAYDINGAYDTTRYTNWQKTLIGNPAHFSNAQINVSGGNEKTQFLIGGSYSIQGTVYPGDFDDKKASAHISLTHSSANDRLHLVFSANYVNDNSNIPQVDFTSSINLAPDAPALFDANGNLNWQIFDGASSWNNPLSYKFQPAGAITDNLISSLNLSYEILPGLLLKSNFGYTHDQMNQTLLNPATLTEQPPYNLSTYSIYNAATTDFQTWIVEPQLTYQKKIGKGLLEFVGGSSFQQNIQTTETTYALGFTNDALISNPLNASLTGIGGTGYSLYHYDAIFGRLAYNWKEKYLLNITARRDGSSRFGPGKQFGNFGAIGAGWIFSKERLVQDNLPFLSFGKLRTSYGTAGNDQIGDYQYLSSYSTIPLTYQNIAGLYPSIIANPYYSWEVVKKLQVGLDLGFLKDRILLSAAYYRNRDGNQLVGYPLPEVTGFNSIQANFPALVQNKGGEFTLNTTNVRTKSFTWSSSINLTIPENKLLSYPNIKNSTYQYQYAVGHSLFSTYMFHFTGVDSQTGVSEFYSTQGKTDTTNPQYPQDLIISKPITSKFYGGFQNSFRYKAFQLDVLFQFVNQLGKNTFNFFPEPGRFFSSGIGNQPAVVLSRWQKEGDITNVGLYSANMKADPNYALGNSDYIISNASFIRLKNLALSYQLPQTWQTKCHVQDASVYLQCQNLFTITKYPGLDPETQGLNLPPLRMITGGIRLQL